MTEQEKNYLVKFVESFLNDELGNRITKWNGNAFVQTFNVEIEKIYQKYKLEEDKKNEKNDENASEVTDKIKNSQPKLLKKVN